MQQGDGLALTVIAGVNFMEKTISIKGSEITFSIWDLGGPSLPLLCVPAASVLTAAQAKRSS